MACDPGHRAHFRVSLSVEESVVELRSAHRRLQGSLVMTDIGNVAVANVRGGPVPVACARLLQVQLDDGVTVDALAPMFPTVVVVQANNGEVQEVSTISRARIPTFKFRVQLEDTSGFP